MINFLPLFLLFCHLSCTHSSFTSFGSHSVPFLHLIPHAFYQQHGYTVVVDGWSGGEAVPAGPYLLRIVSSSPNLPQREQVNRAGQNGAPSEKLTSSFTANSIQQYYLPDRDLRIFRYPIPTHLDMRGAFMDLLYFYTPGQYMHIYCSTYRITTHVMARVAM